MTTNPITDHPDPSPTVPPDFRLELPLGLLGFEAVKAYHLVTTPEEEPFMRLSMIGQPGHTFFVIPPASVVANYQPELSPEDVRFLSLNDPSEALVINIVTLRREGRATVNLKGPVVVNRRTGIGKQVIPLNAAVYPLQHPLPTAA